MKRRNWFKENPFIGSPKGNRNEGLDFTMPQGIPIKRKEPPDTK